MSEKQKVETVPVYRVENPNIPAQPDGGVSHDDLVGQWFSPNVDSALLYLRKASQTFGKNSVPVDGAQLVVAQVPADQLNSLHVSQHPIGSMMDVEGDNYLVPRDGSIPTKVVPLDEPLGELKGHLGEFDKYKEAKERVRAYAGLVAVNHAA